MNRVRLVQLCITVFALLLPAPGLAQDAQQDKAAVVASVKMALQQQDLAAAQGQLGALRQLLETELTRAKEKRHEAHEISRE